MSVHSAPAAGRDEADPRRVEQGLQQARRHDAYQGDEGGKMLILVIYKCY